MKLGKVVRDDTIRRLQLRNPTVRTESFNRPNLKYEIRPKKAGILDEVTATEPHPLRASHVLVRGGGIVTGEVLFTKYQCRPCGDSVEAVLASCWL